MPVGTSCRNNCDKTEWLSTASIADRNISFADTGGGISPENISRTFEPDFTTKQDGNGLGLLIVRRIIRAHGGEVVIENSPGRGLTLTIRLPQADRRVRFLRERS